MDGKATLLDQLTEREQEILAYLTAGLSDQQIASALFLSHNTVRWYNRQIYSKLGVGSRTQAIARAKELELLATNDLLPTPKPTVKHNLPAQTTSFVGRSREAAEVKQLLHASRLLTLTGTGGMGKTRLSLQVASDAAGSFADGVTFIDLAPLSDPALVANAIASALSVVENSAEPLAKTLKRVLAPQKLLLLIDNFEHVILAAPLVSELLAACPDLKILVTSRESLHLSGEQEYPVYPLSLPDDLRSARDLIDSEAGALFIQRAQLTQPHFEVTNDNAEAIAQICARLDGLPLAIELAAARIKLLTPEVLLERLDGKPLQALSGGLRDAPPRHRTLRESIEWSYDLLNEAEKMLFARLSVFRGGRSLEAIEAVCGQDLPIDVFDGLASLVDKSLVRQKETAGSEPRFVMLEMIQEFAHERLQASGELEALRRRHAEYFVAMAKRAEPELRLTGFDSWSERFQLEQGNIRAVLEWSLGVGDVVLGVRLAGALGSYWYGKGYHVEGISWYQRLLGRLDEAPLSEQARFLVSAGEVMCVQDLDIAREIFTRSLDASRQLGDVLGEAWSLAYLGYTMQQDPQAAMLVEAEALALFRRYDYLPGIAQSLNIVGEIARLNGDDQRAKIAYEECLGICERTGEVRRICYLYENLSFIAQHEGDFERSVQMARLSLNLGLKRNDMRDMAKTLATMAGSLSMNGQAELAALLFSATEAAYERMGTLSLPSDKPEYERILTMIHSQLDDETFERAWAAGHAMPLLEAVALA